MANEDSRSEPAVAGMRGGEVAGAASLWLGGCSWMRSAPVVMVSMESPSARGEPTGVRVSMGGGVSASTSGRSGSAEAESWRRPFPFGVDSRPGLPWIGGDGSAERPRMIPSSTSRFLASMVVLRLTSSKCWDSSLASAVLLVWRSFSRPSTSARRALMLSETAPSALARDLSSELRRAACTGGVGVEVFGSVSLSYSRFAAEAAPVAATTALETAIWKGKIGWSSKGAEGPDGLENSDPPRSGFLPDERDLSSSAEISVPSSGKWRESSHHQSELLPLPESAARIFAFVAKPR